MSVSRDGFLKGRGPKLRKIFLDEFNDDMYLREPSVREYEEFMNRHRKNVAAGNATANFRARVIVLVCANEDGSPMFTVKDEGLIDSLPLSAIEKVFTEAQKMLGWDDNESEQQEKNSPPTTGGDSTTD